MMKAFLPVAGFIFLLSACSSSENTREITVTNTSSIALTDKAVSVKRGLLFPEDSSLSFPIVVSSQGDTIPAQLDDTDGDGEWDELFFVADLDAGTTRKYTLNWSSEAPEYKVRTSIRFGKRMNKEEAVHPALSETVMARDMPRGLGYQRYQTDGPSWENDKVGFRHYLDGRNAKDVFGKKTADISPENVGINEKGEVEDNYHVMESWGRDILAVGNSVGIGGLAFIKDSGFLRLGVTVDDTLNNVERTDFRILSEGPVRSMFEIDYKDWNPGDNGKYSLKETSSIWPGMYAFQNQVDIGAAPEGSQLGIGIVNINAENPPREVKINDEWIALVSHEKHTYNKEWWLGLALLVPADAYGGVAKAPDTGKLSGSYFARMKPADGTVTYYAIACWEGSEKRFADAGAFTTYVKQLGAELSARVEVSVQ